MTLTKQYMSPERAGHEPTAESVKPKHGRNFSQKTILSQNGATALNKRYTLKNPINNVVQVVDAGALGNYSRNKLETSTMRNGAPQDLMSIDERVKRD